MPLFRHGLFQFRRPALLFRQVGWLLLALGAGCSPSLNWREVRLPASQGLVMTFPCKPEPQQRLVQLPGLSGPPVQLHILACEADGATWAISHFDTHSPERWVRALALWQSSVLANLAVLPGQAVAQKQGLAAFEVPGSTPHPDAVTWWATGQRPVSLKASEPVAVKVWHFAKGMQVFQASVWAPSLQPDDPRLTTFAKGIHFQP
jgi:hypothetical protein